MTEAAGAAGFSRPGDGWLHRLNPVPKLLLLAWAAIAPFILPAVGIPVLIGLVVIVALSARLGLPYLRALVVAALVVVASIVVVNGFFYPGSHRVIVSIGPLALTEEGLAFGLPIASRVLAAVAATVAFAMTTRPDDLMESLIQRGVDRRLAFVILSALQAIPRLLDRGRRILEAQQARGLPATGSIVTRVRAVVPLVGPMLVGSLVDVRERSLALEARAFSSGARRTAYRVVAVRPTDVLVTWLALGLLVALGVALAARLAGVLVG